MAPYADFWNLVNLAQSANTHMPIQTKEYKGGEAQRAADGAAKRSAVVEAQIENRAGKYQARGTFSYHTSCI